MSNFQITGKPTSAIDKLVRDVVKETEAKGSTGVTMQSGLKGIVENLSPALAAQVNALSPSDRGTFYSALAMNFIDGIAALASAQAGETRYVLKGDINFDVAPVGVPDPKKALRLTINLPDGYTGPDKLVYPEFMFDKTAGGEAIPKAIIIGSTKQTVHVKPGDAILDAWSGTAFKGMGFVVRNEADNNVIPVSADGVAAQILVNSVDTVKLAKVVAIFGGKTPGDLSHADLKAALTRVANEVSTDMYLGENAQYAANNLDPIDTSHPGIGLHSKKGMLTSAVRIDGPVQFNSPDAGTSEQSFSNGAVIIRTTVQNEDKTFRVVERAINPEKFDADGYKDTAGNPMTFASLPAATFHKKPE